MTQKPAGDRGGDAGSRREGTRVQLQDGWGLRIACVLGNTVLYHWDLLRKENLSILSKEKGEMSQWIP